MVFSGRYRETWKNWYASNAEVRLDKTSYGPHVGEKVIWYKLSVDSPFETLSFSSIPASDYNKQESDYRALVAAIKMIDDTPASSIPDHRDSSEALFLREMYADLCVENGGHAAAKQFLEDEAERWRSEDRENSAPL